jgi:hypothetical protein
LFILIDLTILINRLMFGFIYAGLVWITPQFQSSDGQFPFYYYLMVVIIYAIHQVLSTVKWMPSLPLLFGMYF